LEEYKNTVRVFEAEPKKHYSYKKITCIIPTVGRSTRMHWIYQNFDHIYCSSIFAWYA